MNIFKTLSIFYHCDIIPKFQIGDKCFYRKIISLGAEWCPPEEELLLAIILEVSKKRLGLFKQWMYTIKVNDDILIVCESQLKEMPQ